MVGILACLVFLLLLFCRICSLLVVFPFLLHHQLYQAINSLEFSNFIYCSMIFIALLDGVLFF